MESMIRKVVVEEVTKAINGINDDKPILVKDDSPTQPKPAQPKKKQRTLNRMSKLLATVNSKGNKSKNKSSDFKSIKIQIRWQKRGEEAFVKTEYGGGQRYVQFGDQDDPTFLELLSKGQSYYYPNGENGFEEKLENAVCKILSAGGQRIPNNQKIREYLDENGCFPSKTYFVFETKDLSDDYDNDDDGDNKLAPFPLRPIDQISGSSKRKICSTCSGTYLDFCLRCDQDQAFKESLNTDQLKEKENQENHQGKLENNEIHNLQNTDETRESLGIGDIRQKRLSFFKGAPNDSYDENLAVIRSKFKSSEWEHKEFSIRRRFVVKDVLTKMKIFFQDKPLEPVKATFLSCGSTEAAVDDGGPMKELVTVFYEKINGVLTQGPPNNQVLIHDSAVLKREDYFYFGKFVSLCILQGLDTPKQFSKGLVEYIIDGSQSCSCTIGDIVDPDLCQKLKKIIDASESEFSEAVDNFPERFDLGYNEFNPKFLDKSKLIQAVAHSFTVSSKLEEIQQFMDGLATFGILDLLRQFPIEGKKLLLFENEVSPVALKKSFVCKQQNESEQNVIFNLYNLIDEISSKKFKNVSAFTFDEVEEGIVADEKKRNLKFRLADILMFFTGSRFLQPSLQIPVKFNDKSTRRLSVSTCLPEVVFPLSERYTGEMFSDNFIEDVLCSPGFGNA